MRKHASAWVIKYKNKKTKTKRRNIFVHEIRMELLIECRSFTVVDTVLLTVEICALLKDGVMDAEDSPSVGEVDVSIVEDDSPIVEVVDDSIVEDDSPIVEVVDAVSTVEVVDKLPVEYDSPINEVVDESTVEDNSQIIEVVDAASTFVKELTVEEVDEVG